MSLEPAPATIAPSPPTSPAISSTRRTCSSSVSVAASPVVPATTRPWEPFASRWRAIATDASSLTRPSAWNGVTIAVSRPSYGSMRDSFARRPAGTRADGVRSPVPGGSARERIPAGELRRRVARVVAVLVGRVALGARARRAGPGRDRARLRRAARRRTRSAGRPAARPAAELGAAASTGAPGSVGGTPGVAGAGGAWDVPASGSPCGGAAGGASLAIGRPCLSYSTAGAPAPSPDCWPELNCFCASSSLACACSAIFLALSMKPMGEGYPRPVSDPVLGVRLTVSCCGTSVAGQPPACAPGVTRHSVTTTSSPRGLVLQADVDDVALAHVDRPALGGGARRRLARVVARGPGPAHARRDLGAGVERAAHPLAEALRRVVGHRDEHDPAVSPRARAAARAPR